MNTMTMTVDLSLLEEAKRLGHIQSESEVVDVALKEYILRHKQLQILEVEGSIDFWEDYDHKKLRHRESC